MAQLQDNRCKHGTGRGIGSMGGGITLQIKEKAETGGELKAYIYLIMDAQVPEKARRLGYNS